MFLIYAVTPRACAQAVRKSAEIGWKPLRFLASGCANRDTVMVPAGADNAKGVLSVGALKPHNSDPADVGMAAYNALMKERLPNADRTNLAAIYGYTVAQALVTVIEQSKNDLTRENIMAQATRMKNVSLPLFLPGIVLNTSPDDYRPFKDGYMIEFNGEEWKVVSELLRGS